MLEEENQFKLPANLRSFRLAAIGIRKLGEWLKSEINTTHERPGSSKESLRILDYGCGYFDLGLYLKDIANVCVDGFEPEAISAECSRQRCQTALRKSSIFTDKRSIPRGVYDIVTLNSVLQYFSGVEDLKIFLADVRGYLNPNSPVAELVITDIIPLKYSKHSDLALSLWDAFWQGILWHMVKHCISVMSQGTHQRYFQIDATELSDLALDNKFHAERLPQNLSPSRFRYSLKLKLNKED